MLRIASGALTGRLLEAVEDLTALAHGEDVGPRGLEGGVGGIAGEQLDAEAPLGQGGSHALDDRGVILDPPGRVRGLAIDAPAVSFGTHGASPLVSPPSTTTRSAAAMSLARSMSKTRGKTTP